MKKRNPTHRQNNIITTKQKITKKTVKHKKRTRKSKHND
nr:MAG TPA: hypothetical protein [Caudoviricetes sp.]